MELSELKELGLSEGQVAVYSALLELGASTLNKIHEKTGIDRRNIYDILNKLIEKGFIAYNIEKGKRSYYCTHPNNILEEIKNKEESLAALQKKIPQIKNLFLLKKPQINAEIYRGNDAMKSLLDEMLEYDACYWLGGNSGVEKKYPIWFNHWMEKRAQLKITMYDLVSFGTHLENYSPNDLAKHKKFYYKYCSLPEGFYTPMVIIIFGNKVAQILWNKQPFAIVIESEEIKNSFMKYFKYFWKEPW